MNKKTLMKKLSSLLIILAILIQMFPIATYAQENATHTSRVRHVRALRAGAPETYVKFSIRSHTGENIMGQGTVQPHGSERWVLKRYIKMVS